MKFYMFWILFGAIAFISAIVNLVRVFNNKNKYWEVLVFVSLSFGVLTMLCEYNLVYQWVMEKSWGSMLDVVPGMMGMLAQCVALGILLNGIVVVKEVFFKRK